MGFYTKIPSGIAIMEWPGYKGGKGDGDKHCPDCGGCTAKKCWKKTRHHAKCVRHAKKEEANGSRT